MKIKKSRTASVAILSLLLIFTSVFMSSCGFDPDEAINIGSYITDEITVQEDSTIFCFYYNSKEHPIDEYGIIKVSVEYYVDYNSWMKHKTFYISVPDDVKYEGEQPYFSVEIGDALTNESVVYLSVLANYKAESSSRGWLYVLSVFIAIALVIGFCSIYMVMCEAYDSNTALPSFMWLGGLLIIGLIALWISGRWGSGPGSIVLCGGILYFICTLFTYFNYRS